MTWTIYKTFSLTIHKGWKCHLTGLKYKKIDLVASYQSLIGIWNSDKLNAWKIGE